MNTAKMRQMASTFSNFFSRVDSPGSLLSDLTNDGVPQSIVCRGGGADFKLFSNVFPS